MIDATVENRVRNDLMKLLADEVRRLIVRSFLKRLEIILNPDDLLRFIESCRDRTLDDAALLARIGGDAEAMRLFGQWLEGQ